MRTGWRSKIFLSARHLPLLVLVLAGCTTVLDEPSARSIVVVKTERPGPADYPYARADAYRVEGEWQAQMIAAIERDLWENQVRADAFVEKAAEIETDLNALSLERQGYGRFYRGIANRARKEIGDGRIILSEITYRCNTTPQLMRLEQLRGVAFERGRVPPPSH